MNDLAARLHATGLKATPARLRVLQLLLNAQQPMSHAEIERQLEKPDGGALNRVTLYRILEAMTGCGLVMKAADGRGVSRFAASDAQRRHDAHVHFRCQGCGAVFCLNVAPPPPPELPPGFQLTVAEYDLRGTCARCHEPPPFFRGG